MNGPVMVWKKMASKERVLLGGMAMLEEVGHYGGGFEVFFSSFPQCGSRLTSNCLQDVGRSAISLAPYLPACGRE